MAQLLLLILVDQIDSLYHQITSALANAELSSQIREMAHTTEGICTRSVVRLEDFAAH